nr:MAG: hypothetical protein DiTV3a_F10ORF2 [Diabrotica toursvirus 3a]
MDDRLKVLSLLPENLHKEYVKSLINIYHEINKNRHILSPNLDEITILGGILYFLLYYEAQQFDLISENDMNNDIVLQNFVKYKTIDLDGHANLYEDIKYYDDPDLFIEDGKIMREIFFKLMDKLPIKKDLKTIHHILYPDDVTRDKFDLDFLISKDDDDFQEYRPQITFKVGQETDHMLELLFQVVVDNSKVITTYNLKFLNHVPFLGEHIIVSFVDQIFPHQRTWLSINNINNKPAKQIFAEMKNLMDENLLSSVKFKQGYYRSYMLYYILMKAVDKKVNHLVKLIVPTNNIVFNKFSFLRCSIIRKLTPKIASDAMQLLRKVERNDEIISIKLLSELMVLSLKMWELFYQNIYN